MLKYGCIFKQNCQCFYFKEGNENFLLLLSSTCCASWNEQGDPTDQSLMLQKIIATNQPKYKDVKTLCFCT